MDNPETLTTFCTRDTDRTKTNKRKTQNRTRIHILHLFEVNLGNNSTRTYVFYMK